MKHAVMLRSLGYRHDVFELDNRRETLQIHASLYAQHTVHIISNRVLSLGLIPAVFRKVFRSVVFGGEARCIAGVRTPWQGTG